MSEEFSRVRARQLLAEAGVETAPIDVQRVASHQGLTVRYVSREAGFAGRLLRRRMEIQVNPNIHRHRQRFTIAHEIGHYALGHDPVVGIFNERAHADPIRPNEAQANHFASELLMPESLVRQHWPKARDFRALAAQFDVSPEAMFYQLDRLDLLGLERPR